MIEICDQTKVLDFLSDSGVWVISYGLWDWAMKIETPLYQTGPNTVKENRDHLNNNAYLVPICTCKWKSTLSHHIP